MILVPRAELLAWAKAWQDEHGPNDGADCVTPFDAYLLKPPVNAQSTVHVEVLRHMKGTIKAIMQSEVAALDAAIAALSAPQPPAEAQPVYEGVDLEGGWIRATAPPSTSVEDNRWKALIGQRQRRVEDAGYNGVEDALDAAVASLSAQQSGDWVLVPRDATPEMWEAGMNCHSPDDTQGDYLEKAWAAMLAAAPQPPVEAHCATCSCVPGMTPAVRFDATPAEKEGAVRDHLIRMGWTPPAEAQPVGKVSRDTGLTVTLERLPYYTGTRLAKGTELYAHPPPPPSAPVGVEGVEAALQKWLDWCNEHSEEPEAKSGARIAIEALVQQPAAVDGVWIRLCGSQGEPAGTMTVTAGLRDGSEVVLIRDTGNEIDHSVNLAAALAGQQGGAK